MVSWQAVSGLVYPGAASSVHLLLSGSVHEVDLVGFLFVHYLISQYYVNIVMQHSGLLGLMQQHWLHRLISVNM